MVMFSRSALLALPKSNSLELQSLTRHPGSTASTTTCAGARSCGTVRGGHPLLRRMQLSKHLGLLPCQHEQLSAARTEPPGPCLLRQLCEIAA